MRKYLQKIEARGIHRKFDIVQDFNPDINIIYSFNGKGKTTIAHIMTNLLNGNYGRFFYLKFKNIKAILNTGEFLEIKVIERDADDKTKTIKIIDSAKRSSKIITDPDNHSEDFLLSTAYFPAFRTMIDAWASTIEEDIEERGTSSEIQPKLTRFARKIFGAFTPSINYPSLAEIEHALNYKIRQLIVETAKINNEIFSRSFSEIFSALFLEDKFQNSTNNNSDEILEYIQELIRDIQGYPLQKESTYSSIISAVESIKTNRNEINSGKLLSILNIYKESLKRIFDSLQKMFADIDFYLLAVNKFLQDKKIIYTENFASIESLIQIKFNDDDLYSGLSALSSGERQIVSLLYAATNMEKHDLVLIDEPEISLHVNWQERLLAEMSAQLPERQIIVFTHSPVIPADFEDCFKRLNSSITDKNVWNIDPDTEFEYLEDNNFSEEHLVNLDTDITDEE